MENIRLILADIDGTLLSSSLEVTEKTREAIGKLKKKNILFGIATGRSPYAVKRLVYEWGIGDDTALIMGFNGGSVLDMRTGEMTSVMRISGKAI
ncbi:MAG: HAD family phosphatase, partial [Solobacterium sp.]|nr:HAD family phosphatase [Solobacterium sp.]